MKTFNETRGISIKNKTRRNLRTVKRLVFKPDSSFAPTTEFSKSCGTSQYGVAKDIVVQLNYNRNGFMGFEFFRLEGIRDELIWIPVNNSEIMSYYGNLIIEKFGDWMDNVDDCVLPHWDGSIFNQVIQRPQASEFSKGLRKINDQYRRETITATVKMIQRFANLLEKHNV